MGACIAPDGARVGVWVAVRGLTPTANYGAAPSGLNFRVGIPTVGLHPRLFSIVPDGDCFRPANGRHRRGESSFVLSYRSHVVATEYSRGCKPTVTETPRNRATEWRRNIAVGASPRKVVAADTRPRPPAAATPSSLEGEPGWEEEGELFGKETEGALEPGRPLWGRRCRLVITGSSPRG